MAGLGRTPGFLDVVVDSLPMEIWSKSWDAADDETDVHVERAPEFDYREGSKVFAVAQLDSQEARERKCDVDNAQEKDAVDTDFDLRSHVEIVDN